VKAATEHTDQPARGEPPEVRYLARSEGYEIVLLRPPPAKPLVRPRFAGGQVEVVLTVAEVATFSTALQRLQEYLHDARLDHPHQPWSWWRSQVRGGSPTDKRNWASGRERDLTHALLVYPRIVSTDLDV
jgi:hypothetical protein